METPTPHPDASPPSASPYAVPAGYGTMRVGERPFQLLGSMRLLVPEDEFDAWLAENRRHQAALAALKLADL
ncbi:MAG TPA: hypothetical protein VHG91_18895 [Longimicrobium sp.]|nr:hypothetical protein [Longimicrobium sp.]